MSIFDPMHNVLLGKKIFDLLTPEYFTNTSHLGLCKSQWLDTWIRHDVLRERTAQKTRELDQIQTYLQTVRVPALKIYRYLYIG